MLRASRASAGRCAVAFFNMKHFQVKKKYFLTPQNLHEGFSTLLRPSDRLLRQSNTGGGGARVLVLDEQQRVKGVYLPMFCAPHPSSLTAGSNALGITVEHFLRSINAAAPSNEATEASTPAMPTVLLFLSHTQGVAYAVLRANGTVAMPVVNFPLSPIITEVTEASQAASPSAQVMRSTAFGTATPLTRTSNGTATLCKLIKDELNKEEHVAQLSACSTFFWITQDNRTCVTHDMARNSEYFWARLSTEELAGVTVPSGAIGFTDRRWISVLDVTLHSKNGQQIYTRDAVSGERVVSMDGLVSAASNGVLMLDHDPRVEFPPGTKAAA